MILRSLTGILLFTQILLYGCTALSYIPEAHTEHGKDSDIPVGIAYTHYVPELELDYFVRGKAQGAAAGSFYGLTSCTEIQDPLLFLFCLPIGTTVGAVHGAITAESSDVVDAIEVDLQKSIPLSGQKNLANSIYARLSDTVANYPVLIKDDTFDNVAGKSRTILKVVLQKIIFESSGQKNAPICLRMLATATKVHAETNEHLDAITTEFNGDCAPYDDWVNDNGRKVYQEIDIGYEILSENITDELYLVYYPSMKKTDRDDSGDRIVPKFVLAPISPRVNKMKNLFKNHSWAGLQVTDVYSPTPTFRWEAFPRFFDDFTLSASEPNDVTYEFRLYETESGTLRPTRVLHTIRGLTGNYYVYSEELRSCEWYYWTVRAKFNLNGYPRVTEWAGMYDTYGGKIYPSYIRRIPWDRYVNVMPSKYFYFPIRTGGC